MMSTPQERAVLRYTLGLVIGALLAFLLMPVLIDIAPARPIVLEKGKAKFFHRDGSWKKPSAVRPFRSPEEDAALRAYLDKIKAGLPPEKEHTVLAREVLTATATTGTYIVQLLDEQGCVVREVRGARVVINASGATVADDAGNLVIPLNGNVRILKE